MNNISKKAHLTINVILILLGIYSIYFVSNFWIGSQEQHEMVINNSGVSFFFKKFTFNLVVIAVLIGFIAIINKVLKNKAIKKTLLYSVLLFLIVSAITIYFSMM